MTKKTAKKTPKKNLKIAKEEPKTLTLEEAKRLEKASIVQQLFLLRAELIEKNGMVYSLLQDQLESQKESLAKEKSDLKRQKDKSMADYLILKKEICERLSLPENFGFNPDTLEIIL